MLMHISNVPGMWNFFVYNLLDIIQQPHSTNTAIFSYKIKVFVSC